MFYYKTDPCLVGVTISTMAYQCCAMIQNVSISLCILKSIQCDRREDSCVFLSKVSHAAGCFPGLLAVFNNGLAYTRAPGSTLKMADMQDETIVRYKLYNPIKITVKSIIQDAPNANFKWFSPQRAVVFVRSNEDRCSVRRQEMFQVHLSDQQYYIAC